MNNRIHEFGTACSDCVIAIANDDYTGMSDERAAEVSAALDSVCNAEGWLIVGEYDSEFSWHPCDICGSGGGERWSIFADASVLKQGGAA